MDKILTETVIKDITLPIHDLIETGAFIGLMELPNHIEKYITNIHVHIHVTLQNKKKEVCFGELMGPYEHGLIDKKMLYRYLTVFVTAMLESHDLVSNEALLLIEYS